MQRATYTILLTFALIAASASRSNAALMAYIADDALATGGGDTIVTDQGAGDNFPGSAIVGQINTGGLSVAGFTIVANVTQSKPLVGTSGNPRLTLSFNAVTSDNSPHTVYLFASDTGFTGPGSVFLSLGGNQIGTGNSVTASAWGGNTNTNLNFGTLLSQVTTTASPFAVTGTGTLAPITNPFGLTIGVAITRTSAGTTSGDLQFSIPEPASLGVIGGFVTLSLRRRRTV